MPAGLLPAAAAAQRTVPSTADGVPPSRLLEPAAPAACCMHPRQMNVSTLTAWSNRDSCPSDAATRAASQVSQSHHATISPQPCRCTSSLIISQQQTLGTHARYCAQRNRPSVLATNQDHFLPRNTHWQPQTQCWLTRAEQVYSIVCMLRDAAATGFSMPCRCYTMLYALVELCSRAADNCSRACDSRSRQAVQDVPTAHIRADMLHCHRQCGSRSRPMNMVLTQAATACPALSRPPSFLSETSPPPAAAPTAWPQKPPLRRPLPRCT